MSTELHVYAFAIAANVLLSFVPFCVMLLVISKKVLNYPAAYNAVLAMLQDSLPYFDPARPDFIRTNIEATARAQKAGTISVILLLFTCNGVLLPLEVALNRIWGIRKDRSWIMNQIVSFGLALVCGALAMFSVIAAGAHLATVKRAIGTSDIASAISWIGMKFVGLPATILIFFLLYYLLPNGRVPARPMFRAAVFAGVLTESVKYIYIWSLRWFDFKAAYGAFHVSVTIVFWAFLSSLIMLMGAYASATPAAISGGDA